MGLFDDIIHDDRERCGVGPLSFKSGTFKNACIQHDVDYVVKTKSRAEADKLFLHNALKASGSNPFKKAASYAMYGLIRTVGWIWWYT